MKKLIDWMVHLPLGILQKFIGAFLLCMIPIIAVTEFSNRNYRRSLESSAQEYVGQVTEELVKEIDSKILEMQAITLTPYLENSMAHVLTQNDSIAIREAVNAQFRLMTSGRSDHNIYIFDSAGEVYGNMPYKAMRRGIENDYEYYKELAYENNGRIVSLTMLEVEDNSGQIHNYITMVRSIKELDYYRQTGVIVVDADMKILDEPIQEMKENVGALTRLVDENGQIIYDSNGTKVGEKLDMKLPERVGARGIRSWEDSVEGEDSLCFAMNFHENEGTIVVSVPKKIVFHEAEETIRLIRGITIPAMGVAILLFTLLSLTITRPLKKLVRLLDEVQKENFDVQFHVKYNDEVAKVGQSFNFMVQRIRQLFTEIYATKLLYKETELNALQSQINPHFIYNTLETISMYAVINHVPMIYDFTQTFGQILRYSIKDINLPVKLEQEIEHVKNYVSLLECRFPGKYKLEVDVPEELKSVKVLKLMLQPLVENSVSHGLENLETGGTVRIAAVKEQNRIIITVTDNGLGMSPERLCQIQEYLNHPDNMEEESHIGMVNVSRRLYLYYGESAGLTIDSRQNRGTQVKIIFQQDGGRDYDKDCNN